MDDDEELLRSALRTAILLGMSRRTGHVPVVVKAVTDAIEAGRDERVALWSLMRAAATLGYEVEIGVRRGEGRITVTVG